MNDYCVCLDNGQKMLRSDAYKPEWSKRWFSSKEAAEQWKEQREQIKKNDVLKREKREADKKRRAELAQSIAEEDRARIKYWKDKCIDILGEMTGYTKGLNMPSVAFQKIEMYNELVSRYNFHALYLTLSGERKTIVNALERKTFSSEYGMFGYIFAIVNSHIDAYMKVVARQENQFEKYGDEPIATGKSTSKDDIIKDFLGDEDWWL